MANNPQTNSSPLDIDLESLGLPANWGPVDTQTINPSQMRTPSTPQNNTPQYIQGSIPPSYQYDVSLIGTQIADQRIPSFSLMPQSTQANPNSNAGIQSTAAQTAVAPSSGAQVKTSLTVPDIFTPVTQTGTSPNIALAISLAPEDANTALMGPVATGGGSADFVDSLVSAGTSLTITASPTQPDLCFYMYVAAGASSNSSDFPAGWTGLFNYTGSTATQAYWNVEPTGTSLSASPSMVAANPNLHTLGAGFIGIPCVGTPTVTFQQTIVSGAFSTPQTSSALSVAAGQGLIMVSMSAGNNQQPSGATIDSVTDSESNVWTKLLELNNFLHDVPDNIYYGIDATFWFCPNPTPTASMTVTIAPSALLPGCTATLYYVTGTTGAVGIPTFRKITSQDLAGIPGFQAPTGTGFAHVTSGVYDPAAKQVDLASTDVTGVLPPANMTEMVGDTGSGGVSGTVPAPPAGSAALGDFLKADGTWAQPATGGGNKLVYYMYPEFVNSNYGTSTAATWTNASTLAGTSNAIRYWAVQLPGEIPAVHVGIVIAVADVTNSYDFGFYDTTGALLANVGPTVYSSTSTAAAPTYKTFTQGTVNIGPGMVYFAITSNAAGGLAYGVSPGSNGTIPILINNAIGTNNWLQTATTSTSATLPSTITPTTFSVSSTGGGDVKQPTASTVPIFILTSF